MFTEKPDPKSNPGDCFGDCSCICNRQCTESCGSGDNSAMCLQSCGCPANVNKTKDLLQDQEDYFEMPLDPRSSEELSAEFQGELADIINKKYKNEEEKEKKVLNKKLQKIERKWDEYAENARKIGVNTTVFCNQTCSHDCFLEADKSTYEILTQCLINKCECFKPKLPKADKFMAFDSLIALKDIITSEEERSSDIADVLEKQADKLEAEAEGLDKTADVIDELIEETLKAANTTKEHKEEAPVTETKDTTNTTTTEEPAPVAPITPTEEPATPVEEPATPVEEPAIPAQEPVTPVEEPTTPANTTTETEPAAPVQEPVEPSTPEPTPAIPEPTPAEPTTPATEPVTPSVPSVPEIPESPLEPVSPPTEEPSTPSTSPNSTESPESPDTTPYDEILDIPTAKTQNCNLTCFRECIDLKKYVPYNVVQQCVDVKCHCEVESITNNFQNFISVNTNDVVVSKMKMSLDGKHSPSVFAVLALVLLILGIVAGGFFLLYRYTQEQEKDRAYRGIGIDDNTAYERLA